MRNRWIVLPALVLVGGVGGCAGEPAHESDAVESIVAEGDPWTVRDTIMTAVFDAAGVARPVSEATLSTKLMGEVREVAVREGDRVTAGQVLVRIDASDLEAKEAQVDASIREAEAMVAQSRSGKRALELGIRTQVQEAVLRIEAAEEKIEAQEANIGAARKSLEVSEARYSVGLATNLDVMDAQTQLMQAKIQYLSAVYQHKLAYAQLQAALGMPERGTENETE